MYKEINNREMKLNKWFLLIICFLMIKVNIAQVNYISGNISHRKLGGGGGSSLIVEVTLTLYTKTISAGDSAKIVFGDGDFEYAHRTDSVKDGNGILRSNYKIIHTYADSFDYWIYYWDTNNQKNALNDFGNCKQFYIQSLLSTNSFFPDVNSPVVKARGANKVYKNKVFKFNPTAVLNGNLYGDSTNYTLVAKGSNSQPCIRIPQGIKLNRYSGEIIWTNPDTLGNYAFTYIVNTYRYQNLRSSLSINLKLEVINGTPSYQIDSLASIPLNNQGFKEFSFMPSNTYTYHMRYKDPAADSVRMFVYPLDFYNTSIQHTYTAVTNKDHLVKVSWFPTNIDVRDNPYTVVINARSYYPNDSVANSYETVSYKYANSVIGVNENGVEKERIQISPNPAKNEFTLINPTSQNYTIEIIDVWGRILKTLKATESKVSVTISELSSGMYFVKTSSEKEQMVSKLVIN